MSENKVQCLDCLAIGSLPHKNPDEALQLVQKYFKSIPFWVQLTKFNKNEDMRFQFLEGMSSFFLFEKMLFDKNNSDFASEYAKFLNEYQTILTNPNNPKLEKYKISENFSSTFAKFLDLIKNHKFAKTQIIGAFTQSCLINDTNGNLAVIDEDLRNYVTKFLTLKALWQIKKIKQCGVKPIIFLDEPFLAKYKEVSSKVSENTVFSVIKEMVDNFHNFGAIVGLHCCGECNWGMIIETDVDILSFDAYKYGEMFAQYDNRILKFLNKGGKIAWGIVPTVNKDALKCADLKVITKKFDEALTYLTKKGISEKLIISNSYISPSCGAGTLTEELAQKAMRLTSELSEVLKERYNVD